MKKQNEEEKRPFAFLLRRRGKKNSTLSSSLFSGKKSKKAKEATHVPRHGDLPLLLLPLQDFHFYLRVMLGG